MKSPVESSNYRPGEPLREWSSPDPVTPIDAQLIIKAAGAGEALRGLAAGRDQSVDDLVAFGRLNSWCFQMWYEPMVLLIDRPRLNPALVELVQNALADGEPHQG